MNHHTSNSINVSLKEKLQANNPRQINVDNYTLYAPTIGVYALNAFGVKGKHNFRERTTLLFTSYLTVAASVGGLKYLIKIERPDKSD